MVYKKHSNLGEVHCKLPRTSQISLLFLILKQKSCLILVQLESLLFLPYTDCCGLNVFVPLKIYMLQSGHQWMVLGGGTFRK